MSKRKAKAKPRQKSARKSAPPKAWQFQPGPDPRRGRGPKKGAPNAGRPRNEFKQEMRSLASDEAVLDRLRDILFGCPDPATFMKAHAFATEHGYGKATQPVAAVRDDASDLDELRKMTDGELLAHFDSLRAQPSR